MINIARVKRFVAALRSGKYRQARTRLRVADSFCCLGVACDVYRKSSHKGRWSGRDGFRAPSGSSEHALPVDVRDYYGFTDDDPLLLPTASAKCTRPATYCNDTSKMTFRQIAAAFERTYLRKR